MLPRLDRTLADVMVLQRRAAIIILCVVVVVTRAGILVGANKIDGEAPCESVFFCRGNILHEMQLSGMFSDSKDYVDRALLVEPEEILNAFKTASGKVSRETLQNIVDINFSKPGADLEHWMPDDWRDPSKESLLTRIKDTALREWANNLHGIWKDLGRKTSKSVKEFPDRHSLIHLPYPFIVHAGGDKGRTREQHYWESYWTIHGLLISEMFSTAKGMILNFAHLVDRFGYVPVGNRVYYEKRPQPPLLAAMVHLYWHHVKKDAESLIKQVLPALAKEYNFWMTSRSVDVQVAGKTYKLNRYKGTLTTPRPESYREDLDSARELRIPKYNRTNRRIAEEKFFTSISGASESGWEFSTRWLAPSRALADIRIDDIVPVDLNAFLCLTERHLAFFYKLMGDDKKSEEFSAKVVQRGNAIRDVFWNDGLSMWRDYDLRDNKQRDGFYMSDLTPLFAGCSSDHQDVMSPDFLRRVVDSLDVQKLMKYPGGLPASFVSNAVSVCHACQWDFPNFWPPLSLYLIEPLSRVPELQAVGKNISQKVISALYTDGGSMFEKYDVEKHGVYGRGGEYDVMSGYGPTNGAVLRILEIYPSLQAPLTNEILDDQADQQHSIPTAQNDIPQQSQQMALKLTSPLQSALVVPSSSARDYNSRIDSSSGENHGKGTLLTTNVPSIADHDPAIRVQRVRMDTTTTTAMPHHYPAAPAVESPNTPNVRLSKNVRDDSSISKNCQSSISWSTSSLLLIWVISMFFC